MIKLLVSIKYDFEVEAAVRGGADIIDIKDPSRGSLGLPDLRVLVEAMSKIKKLNITGLEASMAGGDVDRYEPYLEYVSYVAASLGLNYFKVGLAMRSIDDAKTVAQRVSSVLGSFSNTRFVLVGYADFERAGSIEPLKIIDVAREVDADGVMIDTRVKDGKTTFDFLSRSYLKTFVKKAHESSLIAALAGSLRRTHIIDAIELEFDVVGFRGAVCSGGRNGVISEDLVREMKNIIKDYYEGSTRT
ncbi:MAG: (5-formylfuran-3-yl)methyl phosphate synthase [Desulfurococcaceae archaeon]